MKNLLSILVCLICVFNAYASDWISYGYTKQILFKDGVRQKERTQNGTVKFSFENNRLYMQDFGFPGYTTGFGVFEGYSNGNLYYSIWFEGKNILLQNFGPTKYEDQYFLVSTDKSTINHVILDNLGRPLYIHIYEKANSEPIDKIYR